MQEKCTGNQSKVKRKNNRKEQGRHGNSPIRNKTIQCRSKFSIRVGDRTEATACEAQEVHSLFPSHNYAGNVVQVRDDVSPKKDYKTESLDGACFLALSAYSVVDMMNPTYSGVMMGVRKQTNVTILLSKVSKRRSQKINRNMWAKAMKILDLAQ
jgi:hypothetical protein